jgi:hypothetical protein
MTQATAYLDRALAGRAKARAASLGRSLSAHMVALVEADLVAASPSAAPTYVPELATLMAELRNMLLHLAAQAPLKKEDDNDGHRTAQSSPCARTDGVRSRPGGKAAGQCHHGGNDIDEHRADSRNDERAAQQPARSRTGRHRPVEESGQPDFLAAIERDESRLGED